MRLPIEFRAMRSLVKLLRARVIPDDDLEKVVFARIRARAYTAIGGVAAVLCPDTPRHHYHALSALIEDNLCDFPL